MKPLDLEKKPSLKPGFKVPDSYFESFESKLFDQIHNKREAVKVIPIQSKKIYWYYATAAIILLAISIPIYKNWNFKTTSNPTFEELEYYVNAHPNFTSNDIISQLSDDDIKAMQMSSNLKTENIENYLLETESIEYYLID